MHELAQNEKKKETIGSKRRARPILQTRTGPNALPDKSPSLSIEEKQQKRVAARAAKAMAQVLHRRREPRSLMMWGDRKKAVIKRYPDGGQEIIVPQTLTPEQEKYEFPPRSRFLKKLATSTAERRRLSVLQDHVAPSAPASVCADPTPAPSYHAQPSSSATLSADMRQPDPSALNEWFAKKVNTTSNKDRAVIDWMNDVERHSKSLLPNKKLHLFTKPSPTPSLCNSHKIQFKSDAGRRWANSITSNTSLLPPDDTCRKHYVPRRLLMTSIPYDKQQQQQQQYDDATEAAASKIQMIWRDYQNTSGSAIRVAENKVGMTAMTCTGQRTPMAGMVHLLNRLHQTLKIREQASHDRISQCEQLLKEETEKRHQAEEKMKRLESLYQQAKLGEQQGHEKEIAYQTLLARVTELELSVKRTGQSRKKLQDQLLKTTASTPPRAKTSSAGKALVTSSPTPPVSLSRNRTSSLASIGLASQSGGGGQKRRPTLRTNSIKK